MSRALAPAISLFVGFVVGFVFAAGVSQNRDKRAAKAGFVVIGEQAYRLTPVPGEERP